VDDQSQAILEALSKRGRRGHLEDFVAQGEACRWCRQPVRLRGHLGAIDDETGRYVVVSSSAKRADGVVLKACGNRRASVCPSCSSLYRSDARHVVRAGLTGEKGVGEEVAEHPAVFLTLTAPSFGAVYRASDQGRCRVGDPKARCSHGRLRFCFARHRQDEELVGAPLCAACYDYEAAVLHNATTPELWRRFTVYLPRMLAGVLGLTQAQARARITLSFCRVAEFQRRGVVHLHAVVRADGPESSAPPGNCGSAELAVACRMTAAAVRAPHVRGRARFGSQIDVAVLDAEESRVRKVAAYVAKYASKSAHDSGALDRRIRHEDDLARRRLPAHERRMAETAWRLGAEAGSQRLRLRRYAHCLGYGGSFLSKSRRYSTTFAALRSNRTAWRRERLEERLGARLRSYESHWKAVGVGWSSAGEALYAKGAAEQLEAMRRVAWEEARYQPAC
jgi:hypothetical protein